MLINSTFFTFYFIAFPLLVCVVLGYWYWRRFKSYSVVMIGLLLWGIQYGVLRAGFGSVYIVGSNHDVRSCRVLGTFTCTLENGTMLETPFDPMKVVVINNSRHRLVLEELIYRQASLAAALPPPRGEAFDIDGYASASFSLPQKKIDYFFDEPIPDQIEYYGSINKSKYWLHR